MDWLLDWLIDSLWWILVYDVVEVVGGGKEKANDDYVKFLNIKRIYSS